MEYNEENWNSVLESLGYKEVRGYGCYDILNEKGIPVWQYDNKEKKKRLYDFFRGALYMKLHIG